MIDVKHTYQIDSRNREISRLWNVQIEQHCLELNQHMALVVLYTAKKLVYNIVNKLSHRKEM